MTFDPLSPSATIGAFPKARLTPKWILWAKSEEGRRHREEWNRRASFMRYEEARLRFVNSELWQRRSA